MDSAESKTLLTLNLILWKTRCKGIQIARISQMFRPELSPKVSFLDIYQTSAWPSTVKWTSASPDGASTDGENHEKVKIIDDWFGIVFFIHYLCKSIRKEEDNKSWNFDNLQSCWNSLFYCCLSNVAQINSKIMAYTSQGISRNRWSPWQGWLKWKLRVRCCQGGTGSPGEQNQQNETNHRRG